MHWQEAQKFIVKLPAAALLQMHIILQLRIPKDLGAKNVMHVALKDAGMKPEDIDYINVHGTSTPLGDIAETKAILSVFGDNAYDLNISSTKINDRPLPWCGRRNGSACLYPGSIQKILFLLLSIILPMILN